MAVTATPARRHDAIETLLRELVDLQRQTLAAIERQQRRPAATLSRGDSDVISRMLPALSGVYGSESFTARDLVEDERPAVRLVVGGRRVKQLAKLLVRADGRVIDGLMLQRQGLEFQVTTWRILAV